VLDIVAARVVERSNIPLVVLDGRDPKNLSDAILKGKFTGTVVFAGKKDPLPL
jgi:uridylate kinase